MSVASGGSLVTHIPTEIGEFVAHAGESSMPVEHSVQIEPQSRLAQVIGAIEVRVISLHHQAVSAVPSGWRITAIAKDGVIEALEHEHHPWAVGLQWHPEMACAQPQQQRIFSALVEAAYSRKRMS